MILPACRGSGKSAKKLRKIRASLCAPGPEEDSCNVIATLRHDQSATTESHRIRLLEGSNAGPSHFAALLLVEPITFLPANHYDDSELQPFVTNSFTRLPCVIPSLVCTKIGCGGSVRFGIEFRDSFRSSPHPSLPCPHW